MIDDLVDFTLNDLIESKTNRFRIECVGYSEYVTLELASASDNPYYNSDVIADDNYYTFKFDNYDCYYLEFINYHFKEWYDDIGDAKLFASVINPISLLSFLNDENIINELLLFNPVEIDFDDFKLKVVVIDNSY